MPSTTAIPDASTSSTSKSLTLPRAIFAKLSPVPYLAAHLLSTPPLRPNGRTAGSFRKPACNTSSLSHCTGSAVIRVGDTAVVCGIQAEILRRQDVPNPPRDPRAAGQSPYASDLRDDEIGAVNLIVPNVELATGCAPEIAYMPGGPPSTEAQSLSWDVLHCAQAMNLVDVEDLRIVRKRSEDMSRDEEMEVDQDEVENGQHDETAAYWTLYASIHVLSLSGSTSLFDAIWASFLAALHDVRLPHAWWDADLENVVCSRRVHEARRLKLGGRPLACTWGVFKAPINWQLQGTSNGESKEDAFVHGKSLEDGQRAWILADPDSFEDPLCEESVRIMLDCSEESPSPIRKIEKGGGVVLRPEDMKSLISSARERWNEWDAVLPHP